jgi:hypothetical protein
MFVWVHFGYVGISAGLAPINMDEARRIASNIAKLPTYLAANPDAANK